MPAEGKVPVTPPGNLEYRISDGGLNRSRTIVTHSQQPVSGLKETDIDLRRRLVEVRDAERIEIILDDMSVFDRVGLVHRIVVEPVDLALQLLLHRQRIDEAEPGLMCDIHAIEVNLAFAADRNRMHHRADRRHTIR